MTDLDRIRQTLDDELQNQAWCMLNDAGHVTLVDGDVDTFELARAVLHTILIWEAN